MGMEITQRWISVNDIDIYVTVETYCTKDMHQLGNKKYTKYYCKECDFGSKTHFAVYDGDRLVDCYGNGSYLVSYEPEIEG